ncbi:MAG: CHAD domain-containing protein [Acetobacteraceae bacterium]|nr:CHAD domain-containing protein [Pseudomonadota bacterium]
MELELQADPESIAKLTAFKPLAALREGRLKSHAVRVVWYDSPDHALAQMGQTLAEARGGWRVERVVPDTGTWLPAQPPPVLAQGPTVHALNGTLPEPMAPVAAFEGRQTIGTYRFDHAPVTLTLERGALRAVTAERPVARLHLRGDDRAVRTAAMLIADAFAVEVPTATLAGLGVALATGRQPQPRHLGPPRLPDPDMPVADALAHILGHLTDVILYYAPIACQADGPEDAGPKRIEAVHQMRVATRRALSAVSIFKAALPPGTLDTLKAELKTLTGKLAHSRDWDVFVTETAPTVATVLPADERLMKLIAAAERRRQVHRRALAEYLASPAFRLLGIELAWFANARCWQSAAPADSDMESNPPAPLSVQGFGPVVVRHRWKKMLRAGKGIATLDIPALHALRLRTKRARYAAEMFASLDASHSAQRAIRRLSALQQALGVLNDGAVAAHLLEELGGPGGRHGYAVGLILGFIAARAGRIRPEIERIFGKVRKQEP